ncbi:DUF3445 domain-containing protein [Pseudooceanicola sp. CBS1P-1]|uniref:DUF3445 domain-containing protein n=1 Tax=Pseudooceanicola albus TaxID=2692189 RepID=A0A6L7GC43_9RHOB|nr:MULTISPECIES: DUF3445 domain-containing protein [Pseudooceanicola]MBT9384228.1 DUF3445 domain-containing protein [Pseudooceanicola endophyticus]MXN20820.1 DUF3445 domain-containing protein [Pseudooceanicola albus]
MTPILHDSIPHGPPQRMPGMAPLDPADWIRVDETFGAQMALRDQLVATRPDEVLRLDPAARPAAEELLATVLTQLAARPDYRVAPGEVTRPDGLRVPVDAAAPVRTLARLVQQDLLILQYSEELGEHVLTGGALCFPAQWSLAEKFLRPLVSIHVPVPEYDAALAKRVQRLFDGVQPGRPLWRANWFEYADPGLFTPASETRPRTERLPGHGGYIRSERQSLWRLPDSRAVVFGIHTYMMRKPAPDSAPA